MSLSCCTTSTAEVKAVATRAENEFRLRSLPTILFLDEIHRFDKSQQDLLLPLVEKGFVVLVGATTENPSLAVNPVRFRVSLFSRRCCRAARSSRCHRCRFPRSRPFYRTHCRKTRIWTRK